MHTGGIMPDGAATKILWLVTGKGAKRVLHISGQNLIGKETMRATFPSAGTGFPSIIDIPAAGCWRLTLKSRTVTGQVTVRVLS
jgi:hypothetical protein